MLKIQKHQNICFDGILRSLHKPKLKLYIAFNTNYIGSLFGPFRNDPSRFAVQWNQKCCLIDPTRFLFPFGAIR